MGFRFRKSLGFLPGLRLNLTKNGANSLSLGGRGLTLNIGKKGVRTTVGAPGTGVSYSDYQPYEREVAGKEQGKADGRGVNLWPYVALAALLLGLAVVKGVWP